MSWAAHITHEGDCGGTRCDYCGCCVHTTTSVNCKVARAPYGMPCADQGCGCEGQS